MDKNEYQVVSLGLPVSRRYRFENLVNVSKRDYNDMLMRHRFFFVVNGGNLGLVKENVAEVDNDGCCAGDTLFAEILKRGDDPFRFIFNDPGQSEGVYLPEDKWPSSSPFDKIHQYNDQDNLDFFICIAIVGVDGLYLMISVMRRTGLVRLFQIVDRD